MEKFNLCFDLGNSSLKVGYTIEKNGHLYFGKIVENAILDSYIPSTAYYDSENNEWIFGQKINQIETNSYATIVRIKDLLSLLNDRSKEQYRKENQEAYTTGYDYPVFIFPTISEMQNKELNIKYYKKEEFTFTTDITPRELCEKYFYFVKKLIYEKTDLVAKKYDIDYDWLLANYTISIVYPDISSKAYINEYVRIMEKVFEKEVYRKLASTKALAYYAEYQNKVKVGEDFLVFDIGSESMSVTKARISTSKEDKTEKNVLIDGVDGHNRPIKLGGNDIDEVIHNDIEANINKRETIGSGVNGQEDHFVESALVSKQYLFINNIRSAKAVLSSEMDLKMYDDTVPVDINREVFLQVYFSRADLRRCVGVSTNDKNSVANKMADYIVSELDRITNDKVHTIIISGGVSETLGLMEYFRDYVPKKSTKHKMIDIITLERSKNEHDALGINEDEDASYAAAIGGGYVSVKGIKIRICLSLTYATNYTITQTQDKFARVFVNKGEPLNETGVTQFSLISNIQKKTYEEIFSLEYTEEDIERKRIPNSHYEMVGGHTRYIIGKPNTPERRAVEKNSGLKELKLDNIILEYQGYEVETIKVGLDIIEGINVDEDGRATPFIIPNQEKIKNRTSLIQLVNKRILYDVPLKDITVRFEHGNGSFETSSR